MRFSKKFRPGNKLMPIVKVQENNNWLSSWSSAIHLSNAGAHFTFPHIIHSTNQRPICFDQSEAIMSQWGYDDTWQCAAIVTRGQGAGLTLNWRDITLTSPPHLIISQTSTVISQWWFYILTILTSSDHRDSKKNSRRRSPYLHGAAVSQVSPHHM